MLYRPISEKAHKMFYILDSAMPTSALQKARSKGRRFVVSPGNKRGKDANDKSQNNTKSNLLHDDANLTRTTESAAHQMTIPKEYTSALWSYARCSSTSGAIQRYVPVSAVISVESFASGRFTNWRAAGVILATPKSHTLTT